MAEKKAGSNLAAALARAQAKIKSAPRTQEAPGQRKVYKYTDLHSAREAGREALAAEGIAFLQLLSSAADNGSVRVECVTRLMHESGESLDTPALCMWTTSDPHAIGSICTYLRRYSLLATLGIAPEGEDDDAHTAQSQAKDVRPRQEPKQEPQPAPRPEPAREPTKHEAPKPQGPRVSLDRLERDIQRLPETPEPGDARAAILSVLQAWPEEMRSDVLTKIAGEPTTVTRLKGLSPDRNLELWTALRTAAIGVLERHDRSVEAPKAEEPKEAPKEEKSTDPVDDFLQEAGS